MPVKRRAEKRRSSALAELKAWETMFECGYDFFGEAARWTGLIEPVHSCIDNRHVARERWHDAARDAWTRLGTMFLAQYGEERTPWAEEQFGRPWDDDHAR